MLCSTSRQSPYTLFRSKHICDQQWRQPTSLSRSNFAQKEFYSSNWVRVNVMYSFNVDNIGRTWQILEFIRIIDDYSTSLWLKSTNKITGGILRNFRRQRGIKKSCRTKCGIQKPNIGRLDQIAKREVAVRRKCVHALQVYEEHKRLANCWCCFSMKSLLKFF